ncbi:MAG: Excalibur calcium-binding domain protein [Candidatus Accumulibacter adjunctus]|uniref:Excalibur calcium-binding domain protein n=1 Tax=Candidatus Accumulibacter adjunctus TaxID=1454001 RepID=A0A011NNM4_9PROT|nr:MAG: Excalibur calcium-binding domain protein [Candidatus Accumulibacter adjunctus]
MKQIVLIVIVVVIGWQAHARFQSARVNAATTHGTTDIASRGGSGALSADSTASVQFRCDGRTHCSQMTSCAEATYFLRNCPGTRMDGNNDGVPCEQQWCK